MTKRERKDRFSDAPQPGASPDADEFEREMADVVRLRPDPRGRIRVGPAAAAPARGTSPIDRVDDRGENFAAPGVDRREIRKLRRGDYPVGDRRDLHGLTAAEACLQAGRFIDNSRHRGHRCVCLVHGRGLHSSGNASILKARVRECLKAHPSVLAYADAPQSDGGPGAVYVLLRR